MRVTGRNCGSVAKTLRFVATLALLSSAAGVASATTVFSLQGTRASAEDTFEISLFLANPGTVTIPSIGEAARSCYILILGEGASRQGQGSNIYAKRL